VYSAWCYNAPSMFLHNGAASVSRNSMLCRFIGLTWPPGAAAELK
jgi:hypothetical protein